MLFFIYSFYNVPYYFAGNKSLISEISVVNWFMKYIALIM